MKNLKLSAPWVLFYREIEAMFGADPDVRVAYDEEENIVRLYVDGEEKAEAIEKLLPRERTYGNVTVRTAVIPANQLQQSRVALFQAAFQGNPAFAYTKTITGVFTSPISYVVFANKVVQFFADNLHDINGNISTLYEEIALDLFGEDEGICFCTNTEAESQPGAGV